MVSYTVEVQVDRCRSGPPLLTCATADDTNKVWSVRSVSAKDCVVFALVGVRGQGVDTIPVRL